MKPTILNSLNFKILAAITLIILIFAAAFCGYFYQRELRIDTEAAKKRLASLVNDLAIDASHFFSRGHPEGGAEDLQERLMLLAVQEGITNITIADKTLKELASTNPLEIGKPLDEREAVEVLKSGQDQWFSYSRGGRRFLRFSTPVYKTLHGIKRAQDIIGVALMEIDITRVEIESWDRMIAFLSAIFLGAFFIILALYFVLQRSVIKPIFGLRDAALALAKGDFTAKAAIESHDEMGQLGESFNKMSQDIKKAHDELADWAKTLEEKVEERTEELKAANEEMVSTNEELESSNEELRQTNEELEATTEELRVANEEARKVKETAEKKMAELERFNKVAVDRELKMKELKERIAELEGKSANNHE